MKIIFRKLLALVVVAALLCGCTSAPVQTEPVEKVYDPVIFLETENTKDCSQLGLTTSSLYEVLVSYQNAHPDVAMDYCIRLGSGEYSYESTELKFTEVDFTADELIAALMLLPKLEKLYLADNPLSLEQMDQIAQMCPNLEIEYQVDIFGTSYDVTSTEVNVAGITPENCADITRKLQLLPEVNYVELMDENGQCALSKNDVKFMQEALGDAVIHYTFDFYGTTLSTTDETVALYDVPIGNEGEEEIRLTLDIMPACTYFKLDDCGIDSEVMASIRDDYPDVKVVWRIYCGKFSICTDDTMCRMTHGLNDSNCSELQYCTEVTHLDIGHNETLTDISFTKYMTNLECIIISGSSVSDVTPLADHDNLTWVEFVFCPQLEDISCLSTCDNIRFLNISYTRVSDISALEHLPMERLNAMFNNVSIEDSQKFIAWHPDCISVFSGVQPYGYGWRYNDHGYTFFEYYANMRIIFRYDDTTFHSSVKGR